MAGTGVSKPGFLAVLMAALLGVACAGGDREADARQRTQTKLVQDCAKLGVKYPVPRVLLRGFKHEAQLEVWIKDLSQKRYVLLETLPIAKLSGGPGPKRKEGDLQVPEGSYRIDRFNPKSKFLLSMGIDYPNQSDRIRSDKHRPGGDIFIHGSSVSIGCLAMTDPVIERLYTLCRSTPNPVFVYLFPCRMEGRIYENLKAKYPEHIKFWKELEAVYGHFEKNRKWAYTVVDESGAYSVRPPRSSQAPSKSKGPE